MEGVGKEEGSRNAVGLGLLLHKEREMGVTANKSTSLPLSMFLRRMTPLDKFSQGPMIIAQ